MPSRVVFHGVEGIGKTSIGCYAPNPVFIMTEGETGLLTLIDNGRVPETDHFDECKTWSQLLACVHDLLENQTPNRTLVIDTLNGAERMCFKSICQDHYDGNWKSFDAYGRGPNVALGEWNDFLGLLDRLRSQRKMAIIALCHTKIKPYNNPLGDNFDRYTPDMNEKTWGLALKWADIVLFGNYDVRVKKDTNASKGKGIGGDERIIYTTRTAAFDAKNRTGLPPQIKMGVTAETAWKSLAAALAKSRQAAKPTLPTNGNGNPQPPANGNGINNGKARNETLAQIENWFAKMKLDKEQRDEYLFVYNVKAFNELTDEQACSLIGELADSYAE